MMSLMLWIAAGIVLGIRFSRALALLLITAALALAAFFVLVTREDAKQTASYEACRAQAAAIRAEARVNEQRRYGLKLLSGAMTGNPEPYNPFEAAGLFINTPTYGEPSCKRLRHRSS